MTASHQGLRRQWTLQAALVAGTFGVYLVTLPAVAHFAQESVAVTPIWNATGSYPPWSQPIVLLFGLAGVAIALLVPAVAWVEALAGREVRAASVFHRAFALNLLQATLFISCWKACCGTVPARPVFVGWQAIVALSGFWVRARHGARVRLRASPSRRPLLVGAVVIGLILPLFLWDKVFVEDASGDGTECFEFSRSLATHQLPYWDLENGYYGFYPAFMLFAYPNQLVMLTIGETDAATRLPVFFYLLGIFLASAELALRRRRKPSWSELLLLCGAVTLFLFRHGYHSSYDVVSDLAEPTGVDTFFAFVAFSAIYSLVIRRRGWWTLFATLCTMALASGLPFALAMLVGRYLSRPVSLRWHRVRPQLLDAAAFLLAWAGYQLCVNLYVRTHPLGMTKWAFAEVFRRYPSGFSPDTTGTILLEFTLQAAVVPLVAFGLLARSGRVERCIAIAVLGYLTMLIAFNRIHSHYLAPVALYPAVLLLRALARRGFPVLAHRAIFAAYGGTLVALIFLTVPRDRTPHTTFRKFGSQTLMLYDSYPSAVAAATSLVKSLSDFDYDYVPNQAWWRIGPDVRETADSGLSSRARLAQGAAMEGATKHLEARDQPPLGISHHTWICYSDSAPRPDRIYHQILAAQSRAPETWPGFTRRDLSDGWVLFFDPSRSAFATSRARDL